MCTANSPIITDWLMVGITFLYMVFTIGIFVANLRSSKSAKYQLEETKKQVEDSKIQFEKQLAETKRQYEETQRLSVMPYFQCEKDNTYHFEEEILVYNNRKSSVTHTDIVCIKNIGLGTAKDIKCIWTTQSGQQAIKPFIFQSANSGESQSILFSFKYPDYNNEFSVYCDLLFSDLLDNQYNQRIEFKFNKEPYKSCLVTQHITYNIEHTS